MLNKKAIIYINNNEITLTLLETKNNLYYNIIDVFSDNVLLINDIEEHGIIRPVLIKQLMKILKMYRRICDNASITDVFMISKSSLNNAKNIKSITEEIYNTCGFSLNILSQEDELKNTFIGAVNSSSVQKGYYFYVGETSCYFIQYNRRNILNYNIIPFGINNALKILEENESIESKIAEIREVFTSYFNDINFIDLIDEETEVLTSGQTMLALGKIARLVTKYPLNLENNYVLTSDAFNKVFSLIENVGVDKTKKIKGISSESVDKIFAGTILAKMFIENLKINHVTISSETMLEGYISTTVVPEICNKPLSEMFVYSLENINAFFSNINSNNSKVYELSINVFKQLKVIHKLPRNYIKPLRIAGYLYDCGKRINYDNFIRNCFDVVLNSKIYGVSQKDILLASFSCILQDLDNFNLSDWIKYSSIVSEEDADAVKKVGVLIKLASALDASKSGAVDDLSCDILGDSIIVKTIVNKDADFEIKEAMKVNKSFKKVFTKFIEVI